MGDFSLVEKLLTAGTAACIADFATFPLDTAKVRLQVRRIIRGLVSLSRGEFQNSCKQGFLETNMRNGGCIRQCHLCYISAICIYM